MARHSIKPRFTRTIAVLVALGFVYAISLFFRRAQLERMLDSHTGPRRPSALAPLVVVSAGGSGSSYVMSTLHRAIPSLPMNDVGDRDGVKHEMPCRLANLLSGRCGDEGFKGSRAFCPRGFRSTAALAVLYVLGEPQRSVASIRRRGLTRYLSNRMRPCDSGAYESPAVAQLATSEPATENQEELLLRRVVAHACAWAEAGGGLTQMRQPEDGAVSAVSRWRPPITGFASVAHLAERPDWIAQFMTAARLSGVGDSTLQLPIFNVSRPTSDSSSSAHLRPATMQTDKAASHLIDFDGCIASADGTWNEPRCMEVVARVCKVETK